MSAFPGPHATVYYNEAGEPVGWSDESSFEPEPFDDYPYDDVRYFDDEEPEEDEPEEHQGLVDDIQFCAATEDDDD